MKKIEFAKPYVFEEEMNSVIEVLRGSVFTHGPKVKAFESAFAAYTGSKYAIAVNSCTAALHLTWLSLGVKPGDEVIVPAQTHVATAHAVQYTGATPVFVDVDLQSYNLTLDLIKQKYTSKTAAICVVHMGGLPVEMGPILEFCKSKNIYLVEDCAHALGARYKGRHVGTCGFAGAFSFYPTKHITTGEGGMLVTDDEQLYSRACQLRAFGIDNHYSNRKLPGLYQVVGLGLNYRMSEMAAALGIEQMKRCDEIMAIRKENKHEWHLALEGIAGLVPQLDYEGNSHFFMQSRITEQYAITRDDLLAELTKRNIGCSVHYATPVPLMDYYRLQHGYKPECFPNADEIGRNAITLPVGPHISKKDIHYIADVIRTMGLKPV